MNFACFSLIISGHPQPWNPDDYLSTWLKGIFHNTKSIVGGFFFPFSLGARQNEGKPETAAVCPHISFGRTSEKQQGPWTEALNVSSAASTCVCACGGGGGVSLATELTENESRSSSDAAAWQTSRRLIVSFRQNVAYLRWNAIISIGGRENGTLPFFQHFCPIACLNHFGMRQKSCGAESMQLRGGIQCRAELN